MRQNQALLFFSCVLLAACGTKAIKPSDKHIQQTPDAALHDNSNIPQASKHSLVLPPPKPVAKVETYTVVFSSGVPVRDVLFTLAREAKINIDLKDSSDPSMEQPITLNAINQTLPQILDRIAKQSDIRYEFDGSGNLLVMPDTAFLKTYKIDFINMSRSVKSSVFTSSQIGGVSGTTGTAGGNTASTSVSSETKNDLMASLIENIKAIIVDEDRIRYTERVELRNDIAASARGMGNASASGGMSSGSGKGQPGKTGGVVSGTGNQDLASQSSAVAQIGKYEPAVNINANKETGVLIVRATGRQHKKINEFIDRVMTTARRQVLIEATIAEVTLNSNYQQGINWSKLIPAGTKGISIGQAGTALLPTSNTATVGALILNYTNPVSKFGSLSASVSLLDTFGDVKVLSSPKLSVMNNQTATLKVVDNMVYFSIAVTPGTTTGTTITKDTYTTTPVTVSVGFTMNVTPEINDSDYVTINVRPTITRIIDYVDDPNPSLLAIKNRVPQIRTREMESIIRVNSGQIAVLGGLMQDEISNQSEGIPLLDSIPFAGNAFKNRDDSKKKTELVIFIRPVVIKDASVNGDYSAFRSNLPNENFLKPEDEKATP